MPRFWLRLRHCCTYACLWPAGSVIVCVCVCNIIRTPGGLAGARLIAASQLAHDVSQPCFERSQDRERERDFGSCGIGIKDELISSGKRRRQLLLLTLANDKKGEQRLQTQEETEWWLQIDVGRSRPAGVIGLKQVEERVHVSPHPPSLWNVQIKHMHACIICICIQRNICPHRWHGGI